VDLPESRVQAPQPQAELLGVDEAVDRLAEHDPEKAELVRLRYFIGLTVEETADALAAELERVLAGETIAFPLMRLRERLWIWTMSQLPTSLSMGKRWCEVRTCGAAVWAPRATGHPVVAGRALAPPTVGSSNRSMQVSGLSNHALQPSGLPSLHERIFLSDCPAGGRRRRRQPAQRVA